MDHIHALRRHHSLPALTVKEMSPSQILELEEQDMDDADNEFLFDIAEDEESYIERLYTDPPGSFSYAGVRHSYDLKADVVQPDMFHLVSQVPLLQTDNNVHPVMGRVHMVRPQDNYSDKHFMFDVEGDINEGQKTIVERSRKGPFRNQSGASTIMDRSHHIMYRKRNGVFEITIKRGVRNAELQHMVAKLRMHRTHQGGSRVVIIKGSRRYRLGLLTDLELDYLVRLVSECVDQYGVCGLEIVETVPGSGPLYRGGVHSARFKARTRRKKGALHK